MFRNPDGSLVVVIENDLSEPMPIRLLIGGGVLAVTLSTDSFNTLVLPGHG